MVLPLFVVQHPVKKKVRLIWDGRAISNGVSLNACLLSGPDLNAPLVHILFKFRQGKYAVTGDIEEMFHRVIIREEDRVAQRFLWQKEGDSHEQVYEAVEMIFGLGSSPTTAQYVKNLNA